MEIAQWEWGLVLAIKPSKQGHDDYKITQDFPLRLQESHGAFCNILADLFHQIGTLILFGNPLKLNKRVQEANDSHQGHQIDQFVHSR